MFNDLQVNLVSGELDLSKAARVQISMFNPYCTGKYLFALSSWVRSKGFESIEYQVSDTLQRHNFIWRDRLDYEKSIARSIQVGEQWIAQNSSVIQLCFQAFDKVSVSRWDFWINHKDFEEKNKFFHNLYTKDEGFRKVIDAEIENYFEKAGRTLLPDRKKLSKNFLIEEIAVSEISAEYFPANEIYPGPRFEPEQFLVKSDISGIAIKDMNFIHVSFSIRSSTKKDTQHVAPAYT
jgi:hypothetical protein